MLTAFACDMTIAGSCGMLWLANVSEAHVWRGLPDDDGQGVGALITIHGLISPSVGNGLVMIWCVGQAETKVDRVTAVVKRIPGAELISNVGTELSFRLPMHESGKFPAVLAEVGVA